MMGRVNFLSLISRPAGLPDLLSPKSKRSSRIWNAKPMDSPN